MNKPPVSDFAREATHRARRLARARRGPADLWSTLASVVGLGWVLVLPLVLGAVLGRLLARSFGRPWVALAGLLIGLAAGGYGVFRQVKLGLRDDEPAPPDERRDA